MPTKHPYTTPPLRSSLQPPPHISNNALQKRKPREEDMYILPKFDFEPASPSPSAPPPLNSLTSPTLTQRDTTNKYIPQRHRERAERYYGPQILTPGGSVRPCTNAVDQEKKKKKKSCEREAEGASSPTNTVDAGGLADITSALKSTSLRTNPVPYPGSARNTSESSKVANRSPNVQASSDVDVVGWTADELFDEGELLDVDEIPDLLLSDDDDGDLSKDFEIVANEPMAECNGIAPVRQKGHWSPGKRFPSRKEWVSLQIDDGVSGEDWARTVKT